MWGTRKERARAARQAELDALRVSITDDVMARVHELVSLAPTNAAGVPNMGALNIAVRNISLADLNLKFFGYDLARKLSAAFPPRSGRLDVGQPSLVERPPLSLEKMMSVLSASFSSSSDLRTRPTAASMVSTIAA